MKNLTLGIPSLKQGGSLNLKKGMGNKHSLRTRVEGPSIGHNQMENGNEKQVNENPQRHEQQKNWKQECRQKQQQIKQNILNDTQINNHEKKKQIRTNHRK